jgi:glycosyltransferase involved in cell wall biosynthesis
MKILQVHNRYRSFSASGENLVVDQEAESLTQRGHTVDRFERSSDEVETWSRAKRVLVGVNSIWSANTYRALGRSLTETRPDVVHVHNVFPLLSSSVLHACARHRVPVVATLHNYRLVCPAGTLFRDRRICHDCVGRFPVSSIQHGCYKESRLATIPVVAGGEANSHAWRNLVSAYICLSASQRDILAPLHLPDNRVFVKFNLVPLLRASAPPSSDRNSVVFAGRLDDVKGVPLLQRAWDQYRRQVPGGSLRLVLAGTGPLEASIRAWARDRSDIDAVGVLSSADCRQLMASAVAVVVPSQWEEPFGLVVVEAMAAGTPVLAPARGAFVELLVDVASGAYR